jgi:hypothetical protein
MAVQAVKSGMPVIISSCSHKTFYAEYGGNGCKPDIKKAIIKRAAARELGASADTVIKESKTTGKAGGLRKPP